MTNQKRPEIYLKSPDEIAIMREAGRIVARAHAAMREAVRPGISTAELDKIGDTVLRDHGATPAFLNYPKKDAPNFPASITASINNELVHGIPSPTRILKDGDIISLDIGCHYQGFVGDAAFTYAVGAVPASVQRLLNVTEKALYVGIEASVLPRSVRDVCTAIQRYVESQGYSVAREYTGHGVGKAMHEEPEVPNWWSRQMEKQGRVNHPLQVGMTYALEPMVIAGRAELKELADGWTVVTKDKSLCAHFEHTIAITEGQPLILTLP
jgi:methionyl aminopeptidase